MIASNTEAKSTDAPGLKAKAPPIHGLRTDRLPGLSDPFGRLGGLAPEKTKSFSFGSNGGSILRALEAQQGGDGQISKPYLQNPWVYACINAIVRAVASVPIVIRKGKEGDADEITSGPLHDLLMRPNPLLTQRKTIRLQTIYHFLHGEVFWFLSQRRRTSEGIQMFPMEDRGSGSIDVPDEFWLVAGDRVQMIQDDKTKLPVAWEYDTESGKVRFPDYSVLHLYEVDPYSPFRGVGPMAAAMRSAAQDFASERFNEALLANGGMPNGTFESDSTLSPAERQMIRESYAEQQGRPERHRTPLVTQRGLKFVPHAWSPQDMEFGDLKLWIRETIMSAFGVTKPVLGITDDVNRANAHEAMRAFWEVTVLPYLDFLTDELNNGFLRRIRGPESEYRILFDTAAVDALRESADQKIGRVTSLMGIGRSFNEAAAMADMEIEEEVAGGDDRYIPSGWEQVLDEEVDAEGGDGNLGETGTPPPESVLNGAQIRELREIVAAVARGEIPKASAVELLIASLPIDRERALRILGPVVEGSAAPAPETPPAPESPAEGDEDGEEESDEEEDKSGDRLARKARDRAERIKLAQQADEALEPIAKSMAKRVQTTIRNFALSARREIRDYANASDKAAEGVEEKATAEQIEAVLRRLIARTAAPWADSFTRAISPGYRSAFEAGATAVANLTGGESISVDFPAFAQALVKRRQQALEAVSTTLQDEIYQLVRGVLEEAEPLASESVRALLLRTSSEWSPRINKLITEAAFRSERIARTETTSVANWTRVQQMEADDIGEHEWITNDDEFVRSSHERLDGKTAKVGEPFANGLRWPGDVDAPVQDILKEIANCRCTIAPVVEDDEDDEE